MTLQFIHVGPTRDLLARLDAAVHERELLVLVGPKASGKTHLLNYWHTVYNVKERQPPVVERPCLLVDLWRTPRTTLNRGTYATPITAVLFNEILYQMGECAWHYAKEIHASRWYQPAGKIPSDTAFLALFNTTRKYYKRLTPRMLIVDNAQLLDATAIDLLLRLRAMQPLPSAIALAFTLEKNETAHAATERFERLLPDRDRTLFHRRNAHELPRLTDRAFVTDVLKAMLAQLNVALATDTSAAETQKRQFAAQAWQRTQGDWVSIRGLYQDMERVLASDTGQPQTFTTPMLHQIFPNWKE